MRKIRRLLEVLLFISLGALVIYLFLFLLSSQLVNNSIVCGRVCHNMNPDYQSWKTSSHAHINCRECHLSSSYAEITKEKFVQTTIRIWLTATNSYKKPINKDSEYSQKDLPMTRCERCHKNAYRNFTFSIGINMNHEAHKKAGIACSTCHNRVAHPNAEKYEPIRGDNNFAYKNFLTMKQGCWRCHSKSNLFKKSATLALIKNGKTPPTDCRTCHNHDFPFPEGHLEPDWRTQHQFKAKENFNKCLECHAPGKKFDNNGKIWCSLCHDMKDLVKELKQ